MVSVADSECMRHVCCSVEISKPNLTSLLSASRTCNNSSSSSSNTSTHATLSQCACGKRKRGRGAQHADLAVAANRNVPLHGERPLLVVVLLHAQRANAT